MSIEKFLTDLPAEHRAALLDSFSIRTLPIGGYLSNQGEQDENEYILLRGRARSLVTDSNGNEASLNLYAAPIVITPNMARTSGDCSLVDIEVLDNTVIAAIPAARLMDLMVNCESIR